MCYVCWRVATTFSVGVAVLQGLLFAIGGYLEGKTSTDAVECYNPRTKRCAAVCLRSH